MSRLAEMQARFQQKQLAEKEEKMLRMYENQQQRAFERVGRGSAGSNLSTTLPAGKVRQMFEERRQKAGIDRSYPLQPLKSNRTNGFTPVARAGSLDRLSKAKVTSVQQTQRNVVQRNVTQVKNGKPSTVKTTTTNSRRAVQRVYNNNVEDDENDTNQLEALMNNHNLNGSIDDEEFPDMGIDETDQNPFYLVTGKLPNVGGKHPSELIQSNNNTVGATRNDNKVVRANGVLPNKYNPPMRKETQAPAIKQVITKQPQTRKAQSTPSSHTSGSSTYSPGVNKPHSPPQNYSDMDSKTSKQQSAQSEPTRSVSKPAPKSSRTTAATRSGPQSAVTRDDLTNCRFCSRRFAEDRLQFHENICGRTQKKKRKPYDPLKHRVQGTEMEPFVKRPPTKSSKTTASTGVGSGKGGASDGKKSDWRRKHEDFIATIRAAKMAQQYVAKGGKLSDLPPPPPSYNPDYVQCPHCGRRFNETAAERHVPKCATMQHNKSNRAGGQTSTGSAARKRY